MNEHQLEAEPTGMEAFVIKRRPELIACLQSAFAKFYPDGFCGRTIELKEDGTLDDDYVLTLENSGITIIPRYCSKYTTDPDPYPAWAVETTRVMDTYPFAAGEAIDIELGISFDSWGAVHIVLCQLRSDESEAWLRQLWAEREYAASKEPLTT